VFKYFAVWNPAKWLALPVFRNRRSTITTALTIDEMYIGTCITRFDLPTIQRHKSLANQELDIFLGVPAPFTSALT
jgi:hypothetical protein